MTYTDYEDDNDETLCDCGSGRYTYKRIPFSGARVCSECYDRYWEERRDLMHEEGY